MRKIITIALSLIMVVSMPLMLAGCGGEEAAEAVKVGFIYSGPARDGGFTQAQDEGRKAFEKEMNGAVETQYIEDVDDNTKAVKTACKDLIDDGCTIIVGGTFKYMDGMEEMAADNPEVYFLHFSGNKANENNFDNFFGAMEEPRYLAGITAGLMTEANKLGYVAAMDHTEVNIGINAYALGAQSVNPNAEVKVIYIDTWYDPKKEKEAAKALLEDGCDVIGQHCNTAEPIIAAQDAEAYSIGYNLDNSEDFPDHYLTAPIWHYEKYLTPTVENIISGGWTPNQYYGTMADGFVDLSLLADFIPQDVKEQVEEVKTQIIAGDFAPLSGEIEFEDGTLWCKEGQTLTRDEIWLKELKLVKGVTLLEQ